MRLGYRIKANSLLVGPGPVKVFLRDASPYLHEFQRKPWLSQQARPGIEPGTSHLLALSAEPFCHWWDPFIG